MTPTINQRLKDGFRLMQDDFGSRDEDDWATYEDVDLPETEENHDHEKVAFPPRKTPQTEE